MSAAANKKVPFDREKAKYAAAYWGAECQANPGTSFLDYRDDIAKKYGFETWDLVPLDLKTEASAAFNSGKAKERKLQAG